MAKPNPLAGPSTARFNRAWSPVTIVLALSAATLILVGLIHLIARIVAA